MSETTTRRDVLMAGLAVSAAGVTAAQGQSRRFRVAIAGDYEDLALGGAAWSSLGPEVEVVSFKAPFRNTQETIQALREFDAVGLMRERVPMPKAVLEQLPRLKLIVFSGLMNETLDHAAAAARNIVVCRSLGMGGGDGPATSQGAGDSAAANQGGGSPSELALALMLGCAKHLPAADALIRRGGWAFEPNIPLRGKVLGIAGYGSIGKPVARYGQALGMKVLGFSRSLTDEAARTEGVVNADLETLLRQSDVISIHLPLTAATRGLIGAREIGWMKPGVILINTARAHILDESAVFAALRSRHIGMAGLDVFWEEPLPAAHPLLQLPNVVMTPHIGYVTAAAMASRYKAMLAIVAAYRNGAIEGRYTPDNAAADERTGSS